MKLWISKNNTNIQIPCTRQGLRLRFERGVDCEVRRALLEFAAWLRTEFNFPVRLLVYVKSAEMIKCRDGDWAYGTCLCPNELSVEPYIRLATGDYGKLCEEFGKDNALATVLACMAHELTHYYQWLGNADEDEKLTERQAKYYASKIVDMYAQTREHP